MIFDFDHVQNIITNKEKNDHIQLKKKMVVWWSSHTMVCTGHLYIQHIYTHVIRDIWRHHLFGIIIIIFEFFFLWIESILFSLFFLIINVHHLTILNWKISFSNSDLLLLLLILFNRILRHVRVCVCVCRLNPGYITSIVVNVNIRHWHQSFISW